MQRAVPSMSIPLEKGLKNVQVPMLFMYGKHDVLVHPENALARAKSVNLRIQSLIYERSCHTPFVEESERFNHDLNNFARSL